MQTALTIAGSDSGGGAGIQADLRTFQAHGVFGTSAITAITAQNTLGVHAVHALPHTLVVAQIDAIAGDFAVAATKIGMLANAAIIHAVADALARHPLGPLVLDPVMVAKGGDALLSPDAVSALATRLVPMASVLTPNLPEAEALLGIRITTVADMREAAHALVARGAQAVVIKGGHLDGPATDVFASAGLIETLSAPRVATPHTHGTGCTFASAVAARLALGAAPLEAVRSAKAYVHRAIERAPRLGHGHGPLGIG